MKREELQKVADKIVGAVATANGAALPKPGTPDREIVDLAVGLVVDTLSLLERAVVAIETIAFKEDLELVNLKGDIGVMRDGAFVCLKRGGGA